MHHTYMRDTYSTVAGHRFVAFLGNDSVWYVLDPTLGKTLMPIERDTYVKNHTVVGDNLYIDPDGYKPAQYIMKVEDGMRVVLGS
jgi:transglutaminase-like putative cysteine protease